MGSKDKENKLIKDIQNKYLDKTENEIKLDKLRKLDKKVLLFPTIFSYTFGIIAALILGVGMCLAMNVIGDNMMILGICIGVVGIILCIINYFIYKKLLLSRRNKYKEEILALSNELLNNKE